MINADDRYERSIRYLYGLQSLGIKLGLRNIRGLLREVGDPQRRFRSIHIAGTNGKGSTAALLASMLQAAGYRTGLYTSPHLVDFGERIKVDGIPIPAEEIIRLCDAVRPRVDKRRATFFEAVTTMGFLWFAESGVEVAVVETGLGGRLDATNVVKPVISVITTIGKEHTALLGKTLGAIAKEKAGIIKRGIPCISGVRQPAARSVIQAVCRRQDALLRWSTGSPATVLSADLTGSVADIRVGRTMWLNVSVGLAGTFQLENVRTALMTAEELRRRGFDRLDEPSMRRGCEEAFQRTGIRGRLAVLREQPRVVADVAHNPDATSVLVDAMRRLRLGRMPVVFGVAADKDHRRMLETLRSVATTVHLVAARTHRSRPVVELVAVARELGLKASSGGAVVDGLQAALREAGTAGTILITGSHFVVGEAAAWLEGRPYLTIDQ